MHARSPALVSLGVRCQATARLLAITSVALDSDSSGPTKHEARYAILIRYVLARAMLGCCITHVITPGATANDWRIGRMAARAAWL